LSMNKDIKDMEDWNQKFGNVFIGFLGMCFVFAFGMFFYEGCSWRSENGPDNILIPEEEKTSEDPSQHGFLHKDFSASDWIIFK
jgi:hypothetical protein